MLVAAIQKREDERDGDDRDHKADADEQMFEIHFIGPPVRGPGDCCFPFQPDAIRELIRSEKAGIQQTVPAKSRACLN